MTCHNIWEPVCYHSIVRPLCRRAARVSRALVEAQPARGYTNRVSFTHPPPSLSKSFDALAENGQQARRGVEDISAIECVGRAP